MSDLHLGARELLSSALPLARPFLENAIGQSTFTGAPLTGKRVELTGALALPGIRNVLDIFGMAEEGANGRMFTTDKNINLLSIVPAFSRTRNFIYEDPDRAKLRAGSVISAIFGVTPRAVDEQAMTSAELDYYYSEVLPMLDHMREMGYPLPTTADIEGTLGSVDAALLKMGITPREKPAGSSPLGAEMPPVAATGNIYA
jgi:hypothetical protein